MVTVDENGKKLIWPLFIRHVFRRTAVRNLVNAGVPEGVAMSVTGHKTRAVLGRSHFVSPADLQKATRKLAGTFVGTFGHSGLGHSGLDVNVGAV